MTTSAIAKDYGKYALDVTEMIDASDFYEKSYGDSWKWLENNGVNTDKKVYAFPTTLSPTGIWYNKEAFAQAGILGEVTTMEQFEAACDKLVNMGCTPIALDSVYAYSTFGAHMERWCGAETLRDLVENGGWADCSNAVNGIQQLIDWKSKGYFAENGPTLWPAGQNMIGLTGEHAMAYNGAWLPHEVDQMCATKLQWGFMKYPYQANGGGSYEIDLTMQTMFIDGDCSNKQAAYDFICFITTGTADQVYADANYGIPSDPNNKVRIDGVKEHLNDFEVVAGATNAIFSNDALEDNLEQVVIAIYSGKFETGKEAAQALDLLYR